MTVFYIDGLVFKCPTYITNTKYSVILPEVFLYRYGLKYLGNDILNRIKNGKGYIDGKP